VYCPPRVPDDVWLVDLDSGKLSWPSSCTPEDIPPLPEPEGKTLRNHLKQVGQFYYAGTIEEGRAANKSPH